MAKCKLRAVRGKPASAPDARRAHPAAAFMACRLPSPDGRPRPPSIEKEDMEISASVPPLEPPLRGEAFSVEHLCAHARHMAAQHRVASRARGDRRFIEAFEHNARCVALTYRTISAAVREGEPIPPAAEWVIDNY